jgi:hypothetical protein
MKEIKWLNLLLELIVVIFGVTIAFSLDNWKESRKAGNAERQYLLSFKSDLEKDIFVLDSLTDTLSIQKNNCEQLIQCIYRNDFSNKNLLQYSISLFFVTNFTPHSATYKSLTSSGQMQLITDFELRKELVDHYDITYAFLALLDELNQDQVYQYKMPFLHDNIQYIGGGILNTDVMKTSKYVNITMSTFYFLGRKIDEYTRAEESAQKLVEALNEKLDEKQ